MHVEMHLSPTNVNILGPCWFSSPSRYSGRPEALQVLVKMQTLEPLLDFLDHNLWEIGPKNGYFCYVPQMICFEENVFVAQCENITDVNSVVSKGKSSLTESLGAFLKPCI